MSEVKIKIEGMSCMHCVGKVRQTLLGLSGVLDALVEVGSASVTYDEKKVSRHDIESAIMKAGYKIAA
ncbi:MAG: cation transporter [Nitrospiraceae bacterium]|nr:cation transporter [Nitrospiraceae bacterium]